MCYRSTVRSMPKKMDWEAGLSKGRGQQLRRPVCSQFTVLNQTKLALEETLQQTGKRAGQALGEIISKKYEANLIALTCRLNQEEEGK